MGEHGRARRWCVPPEEPASSSSSQPQAAREILKHIEAYTDGACIGNPGSGGYALVLRYGAYRRELSGGYRKTTNNRMELVAAIRALEALKERCHVTLYSDSQYLVGMMQRGLASKVAGQRVVAFNGRSGALLGPPVCHWQNS